MQALAQNVTVIPARRKVGSQRTAAQVQKRQGLPPTAAFPRIPRNRKPVTRHR